VPDARGAVERVARESYGRLIAYLATRTNDVAGAEDALADAFVAALRTWPEEGVPATPEAWLLTAARRRLIDGLRRQRVRAEAADTVRLMLGEPGDPSASSVFPDDRLKLLFVCAHPAIDRTVHTPLMLQVVLGLDAATIARAFLVGPSTMGQRLSRAKTKIRAARIAFEVPDREGLPARLEAVLEAIYAAYASGWDDLSGASTRGRGLTDEAVWLARVLVHLLPDEPEAQGLLALMLYCDARLPARRTSSGDYVPMSQQDPHLWSTPAIAEADRLLSRAALQQRAGRFQLEAALQSAHIDGIRDGRTDWQAIAVLYDGLVRIAPTVGALVGQAAALAEAAGPTEGLRRLEAIEPATANGYQPFWAVRGHLLRRLGRDTEAAESIGKAIALTDDEAIRRFLCDANVDSLGP
jgi:predicted RNA polymerase sigma factor